MRSYWIRVVSIPNKTGVFIRRGEFEHRHTDIKGRYEDGGRNWSEASTHHRMPRITAVTINYKRILP